MPSDDNRTIIAAIAALAEEIARTSSDCADKAMRIVELTRDLEHKPEYAAIGDAIEAGTEGRLSDTEVRSASLEVARTLRDEP